MRKKLFIHSLAAITFLLMSATVYSQQVLFKDVKITPRWAFDPGFSSGNVIQRGTKTQLRWLQLDIDYTAVAMKKTKWLDDVTLEYRILLPRTSRRRVVLSGKVEYWAIQMDGEQHHAQAFVYPKILLRYAPGLKLKRKELKELRITLTFLQNESIVGKAVYKPKSKMSGSALAADLKKAMSNRATLKVKNTVFSRFETPWRIININYYELIKRKK
jgi:hypothetical protein